MLGFIPDFLQNKCLIFGEQVPHFWGTSAGRVRDIKPVKEQSIKVGSSLVL